MTVAVRRSQPAATRAAAIWGIRHGHRHGCLAGPQARGNFRCHGGRLQSRASVWTVRRGPAAKFNGNGCPWRQDAALPAMRQHLLACLFQSSFLLPLPSDSLHLLISLCAPSLLGPMASKRLRAVRCRSLTPLGWEVGGQERECGRWAGPGGSRSRASVLARGRQAVRWRSPLIAFTQSNGNDHDTTHHGEVDLAQRACRVAAAQEMCKHGAVERARAPCKP